MWPHLFFVIKTDSTPARNNFFRRYNLQRNALFLQYDIICLYYYIYIFILKEALQIVTILFEFPPHTNYVLIIIISK